MAGKNAIRFDDLLLDAIVALRSMVARGTGWGGAPAAEKGRAAELGRGLAGERRYAKQAGNAALEGQLARLKESAEAQLRMAQGLTTPGDEERAARVVEDYTAYWRTAKPTKEAAKPAKKAAKPVKKAKPAKKAQKTAKKAPKKTAELAKKPARKPASPAEKTAKKPAKKRAKKR